MDKPVDPKKVIHSNNYLSFWVKQESLGNGKLNQEAIDRYFENHADYYYEDSSGNLSVRSLGKKDEVIHGYGYFLSDGFTVSELKTINKYCVVSIDCTDSDYVSTTYTLDEYLKEVK